MWMIGEASFANRQVGTTIANNRRVVLDVPRGSFVGAPGLLASAWKWHELRVRRFLARLEKHEMIRRATDAGATVITICNYDKFQAIRRPTDAQTDGQETFNRRQDKEGKEIQ